VKQTGMPVPPLYISVPTVNFYILAEKYQ